MSAAHPKAEHLTFDFTGVEDLTPVIENISGAAVAGQHVWTASDERRTLECFVPDRGGYVLEQQIHLARIFDDLPDGNAESDLEALHFDGVHLWLCGSHARSRAESGKGEPPKKRIAKPANRNLLGRVRLAPDGTWDGRKGECLSFARGGELRRELRKSELLAPFLTIPSRENGLDIEGIVRTEKGALVGLRGPVIASQAVLVDCRLSKTFRLKSAKYRFLDLGALGIRDLARHGEDLLILAGPAFKAHGPFKLFTLAKKGEPKLLFDLPSGKDDHPEAIAILKRGNRTGLLMFSDGKARVDGTRYTADWYPL